MNLPGFDFALRSVIWHRMISNLVTSNVVTKNFCPSFMIFQKLLWRFVSYVSYILDTSSVKIEMTKRILLHARLKGVPGNMVDRGHHQPKMEFKLIRPRWSFQCEPFFLKPLGSGFTARSLKYAINVVVCRKLKLWFIWKNTINHFVLKYTRRSQNFVNILSDQ